MNKLALTLATRDYDCLAPLACGDVTLESIELQFRRTPPGTALSSAADALNLTLNDSSVHAGELSFGRYVIRLAQGDHSFVGVPFFPVRGFKHRSFFVRRGSGLQELKSLEGRRIGIVGWSSTGNIWSRAALREQGVQLDRIQWWMGLVDRSLSGPPKETPPPHVRLTPPNRSLMEMLLAGEIDAITCTDPPSGFYEANGSIVRLLSDYKRGEEDYYRRTSVYPAHHIIGIRREVFDRDPWVAQNLYLALEQSKIRWQSRLRQTMGMIPWLLGDIEDTQTLMGRGWNSSGTGPNRRTIQTLCDEILAQELIAHPIDGEAVFAEFEKVMGN